VAVSVIAPWYEVQRALREGKIAKSKICDDCGQRVSGLELVPVDHPTHPLDLKWQCANCLAHEHAVGSDNRHAVALNASLTHEQRVASGRKGAQARIERTTVNQRSESARRAHALRTPEQRSERARRAAERHPDWPAKRLATMNARYTPEQRSAQASVGAPIGGHVRWHVSRGVVKPDCPLCANGDATADESGD
jgi:hypothetical protein